MISEIRKTSVVIENKMKIQKRVFNSFSLYLYLILFFTGLLINPYTTEFNNYSEMDTLDNGNIYPEPLLYDISEQNFINQDVNFSQSEVLSNISSHNVSEMEITFSNKELGLFKGENIRIKDNNMVEVFVGLHSLNIDNLASFLKRFNIEKIVKLHNLNVIAIDVSLEMLKVNHGFIKELRQHQNVRYIQPNTVIELANIPNDEKWSQQWNFHKINISTAWKIEIGNHNVKIAILDTGVQYTHPDLYQNYLPVGFDWVEMDNDPSDGHGHGTHVSGLVAATMNNSIGISGVANVSYFVERIFDDAGVAIADDKVAAAIMHAVDQDADVINMSWGSYSFSHVIKDAISYAINDNVILVGASGNDGVSTPYYPAAYDGVISVGATDINDEIPSFSNFGNWIDLVAPGVDILSTYIGGGYTTLSGTSMATPQISGVIGLILSKFPDMPTMGIVEILKSNLEDIGTSGYDNYAGWGRINTTNIFAGLNSTSLRIVNNIPLKLHFSKHYELNFVAFNLGVSNLENIKLEVYIDSKLQYSNWTDLNHGDVKTLNHIFYPQHIGVYNFTITISDDMGEILHKQTTIRPVNKIIQYSVKEVPFQWFNTELYGENLFLNGDDVYKQVNLPFNFSFFDQNFTSLNVSSNGRITFSNQNNDWQSYRFPNSMSYTIAPFWFDLIVNYNVYFWNNTETMIIQYSNVEDIDYQQIGSFQVVLNKNSTIKFQYLSVNKMDKAIIGINLGFGSDYSQSYSPSSSNVNSLSVAFQPQNYILEVNSSYPQFFEFGTKEEITLQIKNIIDVPLIDVKLITYINSIYVNLSIISLSAKEDVNHSIIIDVQTQYIYNITLIISFYSNNQIVESHKLNYKIPTLDTVAPYINGSKFISREIGSTELIMWEIFDKNPVKYTLYLDGIEVYDGIWINYEPVVYDVSSLLVGSYDITVVAVDGSNNEQIYTTVVTIQDNRTLFSDSTSDDLSTRNSDDSKIQKSTDNPILLPSSNFILGLVLILICIRFYRIQSKID